MIASLGILIGALEYESKSLDAAVHIWTELDPHMILLLFLPALLFESAFNADWHIFKVELPQVLLLAGPALLINTFATAGFMMLLYPERITEHSKVLGPY